MARLMEPGPWPWPERPRVLLENPDTAAAAATVDALRREGFSVAVCPGPDAGARCPLACAGDCALVEGADVIVTSLGLDRQEGREVAAALSLRYADRPLVVESRPGELEPEQLLDAVRQAAASVRVES